MALVRGALATAVGAAALSIAVAWYFTRAYQHGGKRDTAATDAATRRPVAIIVDNGSYRPASTLSLRDMARRVEAKTGVRVHPASASFSDKVPADQLNGAPAELLEGAISRLVGEEGVRQLIFLPAFLGPSYVLHRVIPSTVAAVSAKLGLAEGALHYTVARPLVDAKDAQDARVAAVLVDNVMTAIKKAGFTSPAVAVCDHGSPSAAVSAVRDHVTAQALPLVHAAAAQAGIQLRAVQASSMERRPEPEYDFNEPLLEHLLRTSPVFDRGEVVVGMLFLSPGKHAGAGGDISTMIEQAEAEAAVASAAGAAGEGGEAAARPPLRCVKTTLLGVHEGTIEVLSDRLLEAEGKLQKGQGRQAVGPAAAADKQ